MGDESGALMPVEERTIAFYEDELVVVRDQDGTIWVPLRTICEAIGVDYTAQYRRVQRDPIMSEEAATVAITAMDGRKREMICLPLKYVRAWLFGIVATRVKEELRDKLLQYQREVIEIIDRAFTRPAPLADANEAFMEAMRDNARQQMELWEALLAERRRLRMTEELVQEHDDLLMEHDRSLRLAFAELADLRREQSNILTMVTDVTRLLPSPSEAIGPEQKASLKALVDEIVATAEERGIQLGRGRNNYPAVWSAFNQRFDLAKYAELTIAQYDEALAWLKNWLDRLRSGAPQSE